MKKKLYIFENRKKLMERCERRREIEVKGGGGGMKEVSKKNKELLKEAIESLEKADCCFRHCSGADAPFEDMATCHVCCALQCLRKLDKEIND